MQRKELLKRLNTIKCALAHDDIVPIFKCFMFDGETVSAYNDQLSIKTPYITDAAFAVDGQTLINMLSASSVDEVTLHHVADEMVLKAGHSSFRMPYFPEGEFLKATPSDQTVRLHLTGRDVSALSDCLTTVSNDMSKSALAGVTVELNYGTVTMYSCDGDALTSYKAEGLSEPDINEQYMLPTPFCDAVVNLNPTQVKIDLNQEWASAEIDGFTINGRIMNIDKPVDFRDLIDKTLKGEPRMCAKPDDLLGALNRALVISSKETAKTVLTVINGQLGLLTSNYLGEVSETIRAKDHPDVVANVSAAAIVPAVTKADQVAILQHCCVFKNSKGLMVIVGNVE